MKSLTLVFTLLLAFSLNAVETQTYQKTGPESAMVTIKTDEAYTQAAAYVNAVDNEHFINELKKDPASQLAKIMKEIETNNCGETSTPDKSWIDGCGQVVISRETRTDFARAGWASAGSSYKFFIGFLSDGSGRFLTSTHMGTISEAVEAQVDEGTFEFNGILIKELVLNSITPL